MQQDWETVMWRRSMPKSAAEARKRGVATEAMKRRPDGAALRKVAATEIGDIKRWGKKLGGALSRARTAKGLSQSALAQQLNVKPAIIQACESGKGKADPALLVRMRRILGAFDKPIKG
tara:strand:+ start:177 stop:533 length:357 start_codon:yes stop_codon:yes gene_type:complete